MVLGLAGVDLADVDAEGRVVCPDCGERFTKRGMTAHRKQHAVKDAIVARTAEDVVRDVRSWSYGLLRGIPDAGLDATIKAKGDGGDPDVFLADVRKEFAVRILEMTDR